MIKLLVLSVFVYGAIAVVPLGSQTGRSVNAVARRPNDSKWDEKPRFFGTHAPAPAPGRAPSPQAPAPAAQLIPVAQRAPVAISAPVGPAPQAPSVTQAPPPPAITYAPPPVAKPRMTEFFRLFKSMFQAKATTTAAPVIPSFSGMFPPAMFPAAAPTGFPAAMPNYFSQIPTTMPSMFGQSFYPNPSPFSARRRSNMCMPPFAECKTELCEYPERQNNRAVCPGGKRCCSLF